MNGSRLNWHEILAVNPELNNLREDEQVNINHYNCPAGRDTKKRLYVRKRDGGLIGFCHHCQSKGGKGGQKNHIRGRQATMQHFDLKLPPDFTTQHMHVAGNAWLGKYGITALERQLYNIGWSEQCSRVILPVYAGTKLVAYQQRRVLPHDTLPKYLTDKSRDVRHPMFLGTKLVSGDTVVLTEDILSAIKVGRQFASAALLGVTLSDDNLFELLRLGFKRFVILLDDDNFEVKRNQRKLLRRIENFAGVWKVTGHTTDPKEWTDQQIRERLA